MKTEQELKKLLGENVKSRRKARNWTQESLGEKVDVSRNTISDIETGKDFAGAKILVNLAIAFETEVYELFKPDGVLPDKSTDIISKYSYEVRKAVMEVGKKYFEGSEPNPSCNRT
jgi:transcriptional regulator with XRE-family HTH domain